MEIKALLLTLLVMFTPVSAFARDWQDLQCGDGWAPVKAIAPTYPTRARERGIEGYVIMSYTITLQGKVSDIAVADTNSNAFTRVARNALSDMKFPPCIQNGLATQQQDVRIRYEFALVD